MTRTINKGVRFTAEELAHIAQLRPQLPEYHSEADLLRHAALLGVFVLAAHATRPGMPSYAGYQVDDLAALLRPRLMPAMDLLLARGAMPLVFTMQTVGNLDSATDVATSPDSESVTTLDAAVAGDLQGLGSGFMDD